MLRRFTIRKGLWIGVASGVWLTVGASVASAQSLGEVARRERAARHQLPQHAEHVYTNEDLTRPQILTRRDQERFDASREAPAKAVAPVNAKAQPQPQPQPVRRAVPSVVEAARHYRWLRYTREQGRMDASKVLPGGPALAAPTRTPWAPPNHEARRRAAPVESHGLLKPPESGEAAPARSVRVRRGDSLWKLAARYLGRGERWKELYSANRQLKNPDLIQVGEGLRLPQTLSAAMVSSRVRVERGDSLWKLAQEHLGSGLAWACIARANPRLVAPGLIFPGQTLAIPARCGRARASLASTSLSGP
jgi:nucleoid-associated protein YgaU